MTYYQDFSKTFINNSIYINIICVVLISNILNAISNNIDDVMEIERTVSSYDYNAIYPL